MICGIAGVLLSFFSAGFLPGIAAVITGHLAAKRQPWAKGLWMTGLITGYVSVAISLLWLIAVFGMLIIFGGLGLSGGGR